jgi:F420H(2)-dependent quinone reductase
MPLNGEYEPSPSERVRRQVELYEATNGAEGGTQNGKPVIVLTSQGAKSGKIRKIPLMRIEHDDVYAVVASHAGAPKNPFWYYNLVANPLVELQDGAVKQDMRAREVFGEEEEIGRVVEAGRRRLFGIPWLPGPRAPRNSAVRH